jgi:hypothetical protein
MRFVAIGCIKDIEIAVVYDPGGCLSHHLGAESEDE